MKKSLVHIKLCPYKQRTSGGGDGFPPYSDEKSSGNKDVSAVLIVDACLGERRRVRDPSLSPQARCIKVSAKGLDL